MAFTADAVLAQARSEIGYTESPAGSNRTKFAGEAGHANGQPWCATFAVAMARRCGGAVGNESAYTPSLYGSMRHVDDPLPGDLAFFDFPDRVDRIQHVGIVVGGDPTSVTCVEGNAQPLDAKVLTPTGWCKMGTLKIGDPVIAPDGTGSEVTGIFPQGTKAVYKVALGDGSSCEATADHLWSVFDVGNQKDRVMTTAALAPQVGRRGTGFRVPELVPPDFTCEDADDLPVDPYLLGLLIGDGTLRAGSVAFTCVDPETTEAVVERLPEGVSLRLTGPSAAPGNYRLSSSLRDSGGRCFNPLGADLRSLGLMGCMAHDKFVPRRYLWNSAKVRLEVLRGLMDTDGTIDRQGRMGFCTVSPELAADVQFLVRSLGGRVGIYLKTGITYTSPTQSTPKDASDAYILRNIRFRDQSINPFRLPRKAERVRVRRWQRGFNIVSIQHVRDTDTQCISVSSPSQCYVTNDFVPTHNTSSSSGGSQSNGGGVYLRTRSRRVVVGFGRPDYAMSEEDDMFGDQDRATLDAAYKSADAASQRQQWAFRWYGQLHAVHVTDSGDLVHSTWNGQKWVVEVVGRGCDGGYEPVVMTEPSRVRVWCRSADRRGLVHVVYEQQSGVWSQTRVG